MSTSIQPWLLQIQKIYCEPEVEQYARGREVLARFPAAEIVPVASHWNIPELHGNPGQAEHWIENKRTILVLGIKRGLTARRNSRSSHFIAPSGANGCAMACAYCYVPRRKGYANPITLFVNIEQICAYLQRHAARQGNKTEPDQIDATAWVYDIGENSDCSLDDLLCDNVRDLIRTFAALPNAKASFATKFVNRRLLGHDPQGRTRIRFSLMPADTARQVDVRTSPVPERIGAIDDFVQAGYEVHLNFSPVIVRDGWEQAYRELFREIRQRTGARARAQLAAEIIFLTHNEQLHETNLRWLPGAEELLWRPELQEKKRSQTGGWNVRYRTGFKGAQVKKFVELLAAELPECRVRYAF